MVKGESRIEYVPYERTVTEYEEVRRQVQVPITKQVTDYYAVQYDVEYIPNIIQEKQIGWGRFGSILIRVRAGGESG